MEPLFSSGPIWIVVPNAPGANALRELLTLESAEMVAELGAPVVVGGNPPEGANALVLHIDGEQPVARLVRDGRRLRAYGSSLEVCELALCLLRTMRRCSADDVSWTPAETLDDAIARVDAEVATTWPSFQRTEIDWAGIRTSCEPFHDVSDLQRWVALLRDGHTNVHQRTDVATLPYSAKMVDGRLVMVDVPDQTAAWQAGVRSGDEIVDVDTEAIAGRAGAPEHLKPWMVGRRVLTGPVGEPLRFIVRRTGGTTQTWEEVPGTTSWPRAIEFRRLPAGTAHLRIRRWSDEDSAAIDRAFDELAVGDRLLIDLRGNAGGSLVAAVAFRRRFISEPTRTGSVRFSRGNGTLSSPSHYDDAPTRRVSWTGRTRFLTDALTYSASEDAMLGLDQHPQIDIVGQPTGGGSGRARRVPILGTSVLSVSTALTYDHAGNCIEGRGLGVTLRLDDDQLTPTGADRDW